MGGIRLKSGLCPNPTVHKRQKRNCGTTDCGGAGGVHLHISCGNTSRVKPKSVHFEKATGMLLLLLGGPHNIETLYTRPSLLSL